MCQHIIYISDLPLKGEKLATKHTKVLPASCCLLYSSARIDSEHKTQYLKKDIPTYTLNCRIVYVVSASPGLEAEIPGLKL